MAEQVSDVGQADSGHSNMRPEAVSQRVDGRGLDVGTSANLLELLQGVTVWLALLIRKDPLLASAPGVLLEKNLL
jgi:hypothetical protein